MTKGLETTTTCSFGNRFCYFLTDKLNNIGSSVLITSSSRTANAKSLIGLLSLQIKAGEQITVCVANDNEYECEKDFDSLKELLV